MLAYAQSIKNSQKGLEAGGGKHIWRVKASVSGHKVRLWKDIEREEELNKCRGATASETCRTPAEGGESDEKEKAAPRGGKG